jgi:SPP1 family phage portal protein
MDKITIENIAGTVKKIIAEKPAPTYKEAYKEYDPKLHKVNRKAWRKDKEIVVNNETKIVPVNRISIPLQKLIVSRAASFLVGMPIEFKHSAKEGAETDLVNMITKTWEDNKLDFKSKRLAKYMMSETECAEIWYSEEVDPAYWKETTNAKSKFKMRIRVVAPSLGDTLYPIWDSTGNLIMFCRGYSVTMGKKKVEHLDYYTEEHIATLLKEKGEWVLSERGLEENPLKKIPVIYYSQNRPEWADVQEAIERLETLISNFGDTNDYFGSPMVVVKGTVTGFAEKGEQGKLLQVTGDGKVEYLTWDNAPEAIKLEIETLFDIIYTGTQTPNITFKEMQGLGQLSGIALKLLFLDAHLKAKDKQEDVFGECIQRRINLLRAAMVEINDKLSSVANLSISPIFELFMPNNEKDTIDNVIALVEAGLMSVKTALKRLPWIDDVEVELALLAAEAKARQILIPDPITG